MTLFQGGGEVDDVIVSDRLVSENFSYPGCGCVLELPHRGDSNTHPKHMILWRTYDN